MTVQQAEIILLKTDLKIAVQQRFAFDTGTLLRLDNYSVINIFDDGRYYIQGEDTAAVMAAFTQIEIPWNPDSWSGEVPRRAALAILPGGITQPPPKICIG